MPKVKLVKTGTCPECGDAFTIIRPHQRFCTAGCRLDHWLARHPRIDLTKEGKAREGV